MHMERPDPEGLKRVTAPLSGIAGVLALIALVGNALGLPGWAALGTGFTPMSGPSAAVMLLLALATFAPTTPHPAGRRVTLILSALALPLVVHALALNLLAGDPTSPAGWPGSRITFHTALSALAMVVSLWLRWGRKAPTPGFRQAAAAAAVVPLVLAGVTLIGHMVGARELYTVQRPPMSLLTCPVTLFLGGALVRAAGMDVMPMSLFNPVSRGWKGPGRRPSSRGPVAVFLGTVILILLAGHLLLRQAFLDARRTVEAGLSAVADMKASHLAQWHHDRLQDASMLAQGTLVQNHLKAYLANPRDPRLREELWVWMEQQTHSAYARVVLFDQRGRVRLTAPRGDAFAPGTLDMQLLAGVLKKRTQVVTDLHRDQNQAEAHLSIWVPLLKGGPDKPEAVGGLLFIIDPRRFLYPMVESWPSTSTTSETVLVRRDGNEVVFLSNLRHRPQAALSLRMGLADSPAMPGTLAASGREGLVTGKDYRGVPVLAALRQVQGTPWALVAKVDEQEIYGPLRQRAWTGATGLLALMGCSALGIGLVVRNREAEAVRVQLGLLHRYERLMQEASDIILMMDARGIILEANPQAALQYGHTVEELRGRSALDLVEAPDPAAPARRLEMVRAQGSLRFEAVHRGPNGTTFPVEVSARAFQDPEGDRIIAFIRDTSDRVARSREIERVTRLYAALGEVGQAIVWSPSREALFSRICRVLVESGGFAMAWVGWNHPGTSTVAVAARFGDATGLLDRVGVHSDDSPEAQGAMGMAIRQGCPSVMNDVSRSPISEAWREELKASGFASTAAFPIRAGGQVCGALAVYAAERDFFGAHEATLLEEAARDISFGLDHLAMQDQRRDAEEALRESERFLKEAQDAGGIGTFVWDLATRQVRGSASLDRILGADMSLSRDQEVWFSLVAPEFRDHLAHRLAGVIRSRARFDLEYPVLRPSDGALRWLHARGEVLRDPEGKATSLVGIIQDITDRREGEEERKRLQSQLHQSQKLESLGSLAGGVAHDMNNVLGAILSLASSLREKVPAQAREARSLDTIINACVRGRGVVKGLLYFARKDLQEERDIDLNDLVHEMAQLLGHAMLQRIHLDLDLAEGLGTVRGDPGALSHALMNLCVNAMDAMAGRGTLRIRTCARPDGGISLEVEDSGCGMTPEVLAKALEPFFTTKPLGQGTGLGLAMSYGTMKAHDGDLQLFSQPGQGTRAVLCFPAARVGRTQAGLEAAQADRVNLRALRILLVDDDDLIREAIPPMLEMLGHIVSCAPSGKSALHILESGEPVDLVVLDMNMPGMGGAEVLGHVQRLRPGLPVILATGFSDHEVAPLLEGHPEVSGLRKPFSLKEFQQKIESMHWPQVVQG